MQSARLRVLGFITRRRGRSGVCGSLGCCHLVFGVVVLLEGQELGAHSRLDHLGHSLAEPLRFLLRLDNPEGCSDTGSAARRLLIGLAEPETYPRVFQVWSCIR